MELCLGRIGALLIVADCDLKKIYFSQDICKSVKTGSPIILLTDSVT